jgi:hypothetical protein
MVLMFDVSVYAYDTTELGFSPSFSLEERTLREVSLESKSEKLAMLRRDFSFIPLLIQCAVRVILTLGVNVKALLIDIA